MTQPLVSVVVAVLNGAATLPRCLDSVARQTYPRKELIVMDGGSTDGTVGLLQENRAAISYWESAPDRGIYHAWNKALARATGDWVCFLGADDFLWSDDVLARLAPALAGAPPAVRVVYGRVVVVSRAGEVLRVEGGPWPERRRGFRRTMNVPHPGLMHHRALFEEHGPFDEGLRLCADYDLLLRELKTRDARFVPDVTVAGVQHGGVSYSPAAMPRMLEEQARIRRKHGLPGLADPRGFSRVLLKMQATAVITRLVGEDGFRRLADGLRRVRRRPPAWRQGR